MNILSLSCPVALQSRLSILLCVLMMVPHIAASAQAMRGSRHEKGRIYCWQPQYGAGMRCDWNKQTAAPFRRQKHTRTCAAAAVVSLQVNAHRQCFTAGNTQTHTHTHAICPQAPVCSPHSEICIT